MSASHRTARELPLKSARERMDIISAYREAGTFRGAAVISGTTHKTVKRVIARHEAGGGAPGRGPRGHNYDGVAVLVAGRVEKTSGRISAERLLPAARAAGYGGAPLALPCSPFLVITAPERRVRQDPLLAEILRLIYRVHEAVGVSRRGDAAGGNGCAAGCPSRSSASTTSAPGRRWTHHSCPDPHAGAVVRSATGAVAGRHAGQ